LLIYAILSFHFGWFGTFVKGNNRLLVKDGDILWNVMQKSHIGENDLTSVLRSQANIGALDEG
jgi:uncharacterized membrane protein YcaP (DUF421 family)